MKTWEKQYAKLLNDKWQTEKPGKRQLDEDELYLLSEKKNNILIKGGFHQCPHCEVMTEFDSHEPYCKECGWCADEDPHWNNEKCAA